MTPTTKIINKIKQPILGMFKKKATQHTAQQSIK